MPDQPPDVHVELHAVPKQVSIRPGKKTQVGFIRVRRGRRIRIDLVNGLPESTIIHWHGLHVPDDMDGHPRFAIAPGERYVYEFKVDNRAGSDWFHPHPHGLTGKPHTDLMRNHRVEAGNEAAVRVIGHQPPEQFLRSFAQAAITQPSP